MPAWVLDNFPNGLWEVNSVGIYDLVYKQLERLVSDDSLIIVIGRSNWGVGKDPIVERDGVRTGEGVEKILEGRRVVTDETLD